jgi:hypothetical protein
MSNGDLNWIANFIYVFRPNGLGLLKPEVPLERFREVLNGWPARFVTACAAVT